MTMKGEKPNDQESMAREANIEPGSEAPSMGLFKIPRELRDRIYELLLCPDVRLFQLLPST